jgi:hypothetical protein
VIESDAVTSVPISFLFRFDLTSFPVAERISRNDGTDCIGQSDDESLYGFHRSLFGKSAAMTDKWV